MRFLKGAFSLVAFSALVANVLGAPIESSHLVDYGEKGDLARHAVDVGGLDEHLADWGVGVDARDDAASLVERQGKPPVEKDFRDYFKTLESQPGYAGYAKKLVFWSGVTEAQSQTFATQNKRFTVGMLIQKKTDWEIYKKPKSEGGYWKDWAETFRMFWDPISKVMAELAQDDVFAYFTEARATEQRDIKKCQAVWCRIEKSILVKSLQAKKVKRIAKYVLYKDGKTKPDGLIKTITD